MKKITGLMALTTLILGVWFLQAYAACEIGGYVSTLYGAQEIVDTYNPQDLDSANGKFYIADSRNHQIQIANSAGVLIYKWGEFGSGDGQFSVPSGIAVASNGDIYVADMYNHRVQVFDECGTFKFKWGSEGTGNGQFKNPRGIATDSYDNVYVVEWNNHRVQKFTSSGTYLTQ
jgi:DNA-binding beta-propeller fold protein YncE